MPERAPIDATTRRDFLRRAAGASLVLSSPPLLSACGDSDPSPARAAFMLDVSGSSQCARDSNLYIQSFVKVAEHVGLRGKGSVWVRFVAADPLGQADYPINVGPINAGGTFKEQEVANRVRKAAQSLAASLQNPPRLAAGSHLVEGIAAMVDKLGVLKRGDAIVMLSDGYQNSPVLSFDSTDTSPEGRQRVLDEFDSRRLLPDLGGITLFFPQLLTRQNVAGEGPATGTDCPPYRTTQGRLERGRDFWRDYATRTGADLVLGLEQLNI